MTTCCSLLPVSEFRKLTSVMYQLAARWQDFNTFLRMDGILSSSGLMHSNNFGLILSRDFTLSLMKYKYGARTYILSF